MSAHPFHEAGAPRAGVRAWARWTVAAAAFVTFPMWAPPAHAAVSRETATAAAPASPRVPAAGNLAVLRLGSTVVVVDTVLHGATAGQVTTCFTNVSGHNVRLITARVHDNSRGVRTRLGGPMLRGGRVCRTTGNWFRGAWSDVTVRGVDQVTGAYGAADIPVSVY